ncbi:hypothetical protein ESCO106046_25980 [Escherichia coli]
MQNFRQFIAHFSGHTLHPCRHQVGGLVTADGQPVLHHDGGGLNALWYVDTKDGSHIQRTTTDAFQLPVASVAQRTKRAAYRTDSLCSTGKISETVSLYVADDVGVTCAILCAFPRTGSDDCAVLFGLHRRSHHALRCIQATCACRHRHSSRVAQFFRLCLRCLIAALCLRHARQCLSFTLELLVVLLRAAHSAFNGAAAAGKQNAVFAHFACRRPEFFALTRAQLVQALKPCRQRRHHLPLLFREGVAVLLCLSQPGEPLLRAGNLFAVFTEISGGTIEHLRLPVECLDVVLRLLKGFSESAHLTAGVFGRACQPVDCAKADTNIKGFHCCGLRYVAPPAHASSSPRREALRISRRATS